jgi:hypothetical protein
LSEQDGRTFIKRARLGHQFIRHGQQLFGRPERGVAISCIADLVSLRVLPKQRITKQFSMQKNVRLLSDADRVHDPRAVAGLSGNLLSVIALQARTDHAIQIHHTIQCVDVQQIRRAQIRMSSKLGFYICRDFRVARATGKTAFCKSRTSGKSAYQEKASY